MLCTLILKLYMLACLYLLIYACLYACVRVRVHIYCAMYILVYIVGSCHHVPNTLTEWPSPNANDDDDFETLDIRCACITIKMFDPSFLGLTLKSPHLSLAVPKRDLRCVRLMIDRKGVLACVNLPHLF